MSDDGFSTKWAQQLYDNAYDTDVSDAPMEELVAAARKAIWPALDFEDMNDRRYLRRSEVEALVMSLHLIRNRDNYNDEEMEFVENEISKRMRSEME